MLKEPIGLMPSATAIATKRMGGADKPTHTHLRRFNIINNLCEHNCNRVLLTQVSRWKQHERRTITIMCT